MEPRINHAKAVPEVGAAMVGIDEYVQQAALESSSRFRVMS
jgi:hypothetical protein